MSDLKPSPQAIRRRPSHGRSQSEFSHSHCILQRHDSANPIPFLQYVSGSWAQFRPGSPLRDELGCTTTTGEHHHPVEPSRGLKCNPRGSPQSAGLGTGHFVHALSLPSTPRTHRCGPECRAATPPYQLLVAAIGRASVLNMRDLKVSPSTSGELHVEQSRRPSIQTRRSWTRDADLVAPPAELLHFNRKEWERTPPLPLPPVSGHQQDAFDFTLKNAIASSNEDHASLLAIGVSPLISLSGHPRSSSAPAGARSPKDPLPSSATLPDHPLPLLKPTRRQTVSPVTAMPPSGRHITVKENPTSSLPVPADIVSVTHLAQAFNQVMTRPGPLDLSAYFAPDLAALLQEKLETNIASGKEIRNAKEKPICDTEWSFALPKAEVLSRAILPFLEESYSGIVQIAESVHV